MKLKLILLLILVTLTSLCFCQIDSYVDQVPIAKQCKNKDVRAALDCTEQLISDYFTLDVDTLLCSDDTVRVYRSNFLVSTSGIARDMKEISTWGSNDSCATYFNARAAEFLESYEWLPARLDGKNLEFKKQIGFNYPTQVDTAYQETEETRVFRIVEQMPRFTGCEEMIGSPLDKETCAQTKMLMHLYRSLMYPPLARENGVEGMVVVQFVVNKAGFLEDFEVVRSIGGGCDEAAVNALKSMNALTYAPFVPGVQRDKAVKVLYTMPIRFKLESNTLLPKRKKKRRK